MWPLEALNKDFCLNFNLKTNSFDLQNVCESNSYDHVTWSMLLGSRSTELKSLEIKHSHSGVDCLMMVTIFK